ncbi:hypothetical protein [Streptomyces rubellomurinus]|uniref:hypothetical protein n=1 Tax=Streptomyces rubellomurinus (strain ATCC 31215) TaxID=359131 RepID=UPI00069868CF|nr:hypothetical protein [Streptomyces rubellomurinus]
MRTRLLAATLTAFAAVSLAACSSSGSGSGSATAAAGSPTPAATTAASGGPASGAAAPTAGSTDPAPSAPAPADGATPGASAPAKPAAPADAGLPGKPDADRTAKLVAALNAIDPGIVGGKPDQAVDRARNQCQSMYQFPKDTAKLVDLANQRFTSPEHPQGFGPETAAKINDALRTTLCPPSR